MSLPLRECGLKLWKSLETFTAAKVTPLAGVWIEILIEKTYIEGINVTPLAGVWIEISNAV